MSLDKLSRLKARLAEKQKNDGNSGGFDLRYYAFWLMNVDESVTLRFIEDADESNDFFWRDKMIYDWTFADPETPGETVRIKIPCRNMYEDKSDPVLKQLSDMFDKGGASREAAKPLWVKKSYLYQGFVRKSLIEENEVPDNPIRVFDLSKTLHNKVLSQLLETDEDLKLPYTIQEKGVAKNFTEHGHNFMVKKTKNGEHNSYDNSCFAMRPAPLTDDELAALEQYGPFNLSDLLPKMPSDEAYELLPEMVEAVIAGEPWNPEWESHWKPFGRNSNTEETKSVTRKEKASMVKDLESEMEKEDDTPAETVKTTSTQAVLEKLRAKRNAG